MVNATNISNIFVNFNNASIIVTPGKTSVEQVIGTLCMDFSKSILAFAILICVLVTVKDIMQAYQNRKVKKQADWNLYHLDFLRALKILDEVTGSLTFIFCAYIIFIIWTSSHL